MTSVSRARLAVPVIFAFFALSALATVSACGGDDDSGGVSIAPTERLIEVTGFEVKGTTNTDDLDVPAIDPKSLSAGYGYDAPGFDEAKPKDWRVASYMWTPGNMVAFQGDSIDLHTFILNGNSHNVWVEAPDGTKVVEDVEMNRGRSYDLEFEASQPGVYRFVCSTHAPTMTAEIVVIPSS
jgi:plastocyanin